MNIADITEDSGSVSKWIAFYIAGLAVMLAICSMGGDNAAKNAVRANIEASNTYAFFQAKNIRQTDFKLAAEGLELKLAEPGVAENLRQLIEKRIAEYKATVVRYESEPDKGEGKKELLARAKKLEEERDTALKQDPYFDYGNALLQIAIVLASAYIIIGGGFLVILSGLFGLFGLLMTLNGFTLAVILPFLG